MDIVERLCAWETITGDVQLYLEAADEITRLRAEVERLKGLQIPASRQLLNIAKAALEHAEAEVEQLKEGFAIAYGALLCIGGTDSNWSKFARNIADEAAALAALAPDGKEGAA